MTVLVSGTALAQIQSPPQLPMEIIVFPERDFAVVDGFAPNADVVVQLRRAGVFVTDAVGRTDAEGFIEVNHPGGVCWRNVTPDIVPADVVRVTYRNTEHNRLNNPTVVIDSGAATTTQNVSAMQAFDPENGTVVIKGKAQLANGSRIPLNRLEVRIVNPEFRDATSEIKDRSIRVTSTGGRVRFADGTQLDGTSGTLAYDGSTTEFTAIFNGLTQLQRQLAVEGQTRAMAWQQTNAAGDRLGMTIYEAGELGGPGMGGCPPGPNGVIAPKNPTAPVFYNPSYLLDAANSANQGSLNDVTVFPERDFISIDGFPEGADLQVVVRRGDSSVPVVGTARGIVGRGGVFEVNHPGGVCWSGQTPDITAGDWIDVFKVVNGSFSFGQTQRVIDTKVTTPAKVFTTTTGVVQVRVEGSAKDTSGARWPLNLMEQRIINPDFNNTRIDRRDIRADSEDGRVENVPGGSGRLRYLGTTGNDWRAIYLGLDATERQLAVQGQSRAMAWHSTNGNGDRFGMTIFEAGETGGPGMGGCPAPGTAQIGIP